MDMHIRMVGAELQMNVAAIKDAVDTLQAQVDAIETVTTTWVVNGIDDDLPDASAVQAQLAAYEALNVTVNKPGLTLNDSLAVIRAAE
jgi:hypothetical protein